ncbi:MAG: hypothetical protein HY287_02635 [Planctomycetes bacterium]|nr:hypothetical protein [Planctomycetota bacterium]MBI3833207.1 hypothetical protein [Planctomycetota bacterium]
MKRVLSVVVISVAYVLAATKCSNQPNAKSQYPTMKGARAISSHYVLVQFDQPASDLAADPKNYTIVDSQMNPLAVTAATLSNDGTEAMLTTAAQSEVQYEIGLGSVQDLLSVGHVLPIGALGFLGTSTSEPFLESAVSLSSTQILLTFSQQMDKVSSETFSFYEIADPDGNTDIDIKVTGAVLQTDFTTVILTTTPQENREYQIRATNVKRRFTCEDGGRIFLDNTAQNASCAPTFRPIDPEHVLSKFVLSSRTKIDPNSPTNPNAAGSGGSVGLDVNGAGVRRALCNGGSTGIDGATGGDSDEELIFTVDRPELALNIVLGLRAVDFTVDMPVLFISSDTSPGFDYTFDTTAVRTAFNANATAGDVVFANLPSIPAGLKVDTIKIRETNGEIWVSSVCGLSTNRRLIDPTRNVANFFGIPPVDTFGPRVVKAVSSSNTEVVVSFSEPLNSDAANPLNFSISPNLTVTDAHLGQFDTQVVLTTSPQLVDVVYTVTVTNVKDKAGNLIDPTHNSATFSYVGGPGALGADVLPRVAGAASTGNTGVLVTFTKPMGASAENAGNYVIVQENVNPEVGALVVLSAAFLTPQHDAVQLTTTSQNEVTYHLRVINVRDLFGNQLAPQQLLVDPAAADFPGTPFSCGSPICDGGFNAGKACNPNQTDPDADCKNGHANGTCSAPPCSPPDQDGDGLPDYVELRGFVVTVTLTGGAQVQRQVTSDIHLVDTDGDGLTDAEEWRIGSDPRQADTDNDQLSDYVEYNFVYSNTNDQDSDHDGIDDFLEVTFFKTNANLADSDGDGFTDDQELYVMNRDPRIADLPRPGMTIRSIDLHLDEQYTYVDEKGTVQTEDSSTSSTLSASNTQTVSSSTETSLGLSIKGNFMFGIEGPPIKVSASAGVEAGLTFGLTFQSSRESSQETTNAFEQSLSKGLSISGTTSFTRNVVGGRIDALVDLDNLSNVAFKLSNLEITVSAPNPVDRTSFVPIATLVPNKTLVTGDPQTYNLGVLDNGSRGPILFSSRDVFPAMVEDLMRDPRGLLFEFANYDLTDEFDRNFAFASQAARDRTVGLVIDFGDGHPQRYLVADAPVQFKQASCDPQANPGCDIVGGFAGFSDSGVPPFGGLGTPPGLPLEYVLEEVLQKHRSSPVITPVWLPQPSFLPEIRDQYVCVGGFNDGAECNPSQADPNADCKNGADNGVCSNAVPADGILAGPNGVSDSIAQGDDIQLIPYGIDGLPEDTVIINAGENGVLETTTNAGDVAAVITGYSTSKSCGPGTPSSIRVGPNGLVDTIRDPFSDDVQLLPFGTTQPFGADIIGPGPNGFIDTAPAGDDVFVGPGIPCDDDGDCVSPGICNGQELLYRFEYRSRGQYGRIWAVLVPDSNLIGLDFRKVVLHPGQALNVSFIQDHDRDGLISDVEFLFGSSDNKQDTDGDGLDDFSEVRVGWDVGVEGGEIRHVFSDPRRVDSDNDGLSDREEQDFRRVQCQCVGGPDDGNACTRDIDSAAAPEKEACRTSTGSCMNVAGYPVVACSRVLTDNRLDPSRRDTDGDLVSDADEVLGWLTQAAVIDPKNVIIAGSDRDADTRACPLDVCLGGSRNGQPCRFQRDCPAQKQCDGGVNSGSDCTNDIDCNGPTPSTSGLCNDTGASHVCHRTGCDDVQVVEVGTTGLDPRTVVVAPGPNGVLETSAVSGDQLVASGDLRAQTSAAGDDQQIALVDPARALLDTPIGRTIIRPGINGLMDSLPKGNDVLAFGQYLKITNPLNADTDQDGISEGLERILGSDPRDSTDGGFLGDKDGDGLTDGQEEVVGWIVTVVGQAPYDVHSNPNVADSDQDGLPDYAEFILRTDPNNPDTDGDGLSDFDELSEAQLASLKKFNDLFPGFVINVDASAKYGTNPLNCDTDGDHLTDDFELLVGWDVTVTTNNGVVVRHVFSDPTKADTDSDGLNDGAEYKHTFNGVAAPPTDPTDYDTDGDGRIDGKECSNQAPAPALAACTNPTTQVLGTCTSNPLNGDKKVTIRYTQLTIDRGNADVGGNTVDMSWRFQAQKSTEPYPGAWYGVRTDRAACVAIGNDAWCYQGGYCSVPEGTDFVFQGPHCRYFGNTCTTNSDCLAVGHCSFIPYILCVADSNCPFSFIGESCEGLANDSCIGGNEVVFNLQPGEGIMLNGEASQYNDCHGAECTGGPYEGQTCDPFNIEATCCPRFCNANLALCKGDSDCPRFCTGTTTQCNSDSNCTSPATCGSNSTCGAAVCSGINCEAPFADNHVIYSKSLSYETLQDGFSVDIAKLTDANDAQQFSLTLIVEITVE